MAEYRSRIHENFTMEFLTDLYTIVNKKSISDNNKKSSMVLDLLEKYKVDYSNLGSGTNRLAVLIDGYVFKFALDKLGIKDNDSEFALSPILYPLVIKTYESNGYISICEYVELVTSMGEFQANRSKMMNKLFKIVAMGFLVGDVGFNSKNFCNWGKRTSTGEYVILDFAYMYKLDYHRMKCHKCNGGIIEYDSNFIDLVCQDCRRTITFTEMRKMVLTEEEEEEFIEEAKNNAVVLEAAVKVIKETPVVQQEVIEDNKKRVREPRKMRDNYYKTPLTEYARVDETIFDEYENTSGEETIFDCIDESRIPKQLLNTDTNMDAYQQSLADMRRSREQEVRTDGTTRQGTLRAVMGDNGRVSYISIENAPSAKPQVTNKVYGVTKKSQPNNQRFNKPVNKNVKPPQNNKPRQNTIPEVLVPYKPEAKVMTPVTVPYVPEPKVIVPDLSKPDTKVDIISSMVSSFNDVFNEKPVEIEVRELVREINTLDTPVVVNEIVEEVVEEVADASEELEAQEKLADRFTDMYAPDRISLKDTYEDEEEYMDEEDELLVVPVSASTNIKEALDNFNQVRADALASSKCILQTKVCPGDPNTKIN